MPIKQETLLKMARWFDERAANSKCGGCKRRALYLARKARAAAKENNAKDLAQKS